jgi:hypothetical protein
MVVRALAECGLYLGPTDQLLHANVANPEGHFEHLPIVALNDEILRRLGGDWDLPPRPLMWSLRGHRLRALEADARNVLATLSARDVWGWKDPRNSLTLPFWRRLEPELTVVVCGRDPIAAARSLARRNAMPLGDALELWHHYNRRILVTAPRARTVVTWYDTYFADPEREIERVSRAVGLTPTAEDVARAAATVRPELRHHAAGDEFRLSRRIRRCYGQLRELAASQTDQPANASPV